MSGVSIILSFIFWKILILIIIFWGFLVISDC